MKNTHVFLRFHLIMISLFTLLLTSIFSCSLVASKDSQCQGMQCEFFDELNEQFEETGLEKDQGYVFLKSHSETDTTTQRIIIRSMTGIYYAYKSNEGWYAQKKNDDEKFSLNELGHFLAEKEISAQAELEKSFIDELNIIKEAFQKHPNNGFEIQSQLIEQIKIDTNFMRKEIEQLKLGELSFYDFKDSLDLKRASLFFIFDMDSDNRAYYTKSAKLNKQSLIGIYDKRLNFYPVTNYAFTISYFLNMEDSYEKLRASKKVVTQLIDFKFFNGWYESEFFIYIPQEKRWYGIDKFAEINKKYRILNSKK